MQLSVRGRGAFLVGEPVVVGITLTNHASQVVQLLAPELATQTVRFRIQNSAGEAEAFKTNRSVDPRRKMQLPPGTSWRGQQWVHFNYQTGTLAFPKPGKYTLHAEYVSAVDGAPPPAHAEVSIEVEGNAAEQEGSALFSKMEVAEFLTVNNHSPAVVAQVQNFAEKNPASVFAAYAKYGLAALKGTALSERKPEYEEAIQMLQELDKPAFRLQPDVLFLLAQLESGRGSRPRAAIYLNRLRAEFPDTAATRAAGELKIQ